MMKNLIPTYEDCLRICDNNRTFKETINYIDGYKISTFDYRLSQYSDFVNNRAFELRGISFVFDEFGNSKRFLMLQKFFNLNQCPITEYDHVKDLEIESVWNKEDGSLIGFIRLPNGKILAKTKKGFDNEQSISVNKLYEESETLKRFVNNCMDNNLSPLFEWCSPMNRIVLKYKSDQLILLKVRNNDTGEYVDIKSLDTSGINLCESVDLNLNQMVELSKKLKDKEGWIVNFKSGLMMKIKTLWYFEQHWLITENIWREDFIISKILDDTIDDVLSSIDIDDIEIRRKIKETSDIVLTFLNRETKRLEELYKSDFLIKFKGDRKDFALRRKRYDKGDFSNIMRMVDGKSAYDIIKDNLTKKTFRLESARKFLLETKI